MGSGKMLRAGLDTGSDHLLTAHQEDRGFILTFVTGFRVSLQSVSIHAAAVLAILFLSGCADKPVVVAVDTLCVSTSRPVITEAQRAAFRADQALWEPLVDWLAGFLKVRDGACLKPAAG